MNCNCLKHRKIIVHNSKFKRLLKENLLYDILYFLSVIKQQQK